MPIIEWISTATNHINIAKYLSSAKQIFDENKISFNQIHRDEICESQVDCDSNLIVMRLFSMPKQLLI